MATNYDDIALKTNYDLLLHKYCKKCSCKCRNVTHKKNLKDFSSTT